MPRGRAIAAIAAVSVTLALAQGAPAQQPAAGGAPAAGPAAPAGGPAAFAPPPVAPLDERDLSEMLRIQRDINHLAQLTAEAEAIKKLCATGYGPAETCSKGNDEMAAAAQASAGALPTVDEIDGAEGRLSAVLRFDDGRRVAVRSGANLSNGMHVVRITSEGVEISRGDGPVARLDFGGAGR